MSGPVCPINSWFQICNKWAGRIVEERFSLRSQYLQQPKAALFIPAQVGGKNFPSLITCGRRGTTNFVSQCAAKNGGAQREWVEWGRLFRWHLPPSPSLCVHSLQCLLPFLDRFWFITAFLDLWVALVFISCSCTLQGWFKRWTRCCVNSHPGCLSPAVASSCNLGPIFFNILYTTTISNVNNEIKEVFEWVGSDCYSQGVGFWMI